MGELNEFGSKSENLAINSELLALAKNHIQQKRAVLIADKNGQVIKIPDKKYWEKRMNNYEQMLLDWAKNPYNPTSGNEGFAFELFLTEVLRSIISGEQVVSPTPAFFDFCQQSELLPSADIMIGKAGKNGTEIITPEILIATGFKKDSRQTKNTWNNLLGAPILNILCNGNYSFNGKNTIFLFGISKNPKEYIQQQAKNFRDPFINTLKNNNLLDAVKLVP